jgi:hypothetical protein
LNSDPFVASPGQFVGVGLAFILLVGLAAWVGRRQAPVLGRGRMPAARLLGLVSLVVTSAYMLVSDVNVPARPSVAVYLGLIAISVPEYGSGPVKGGIHRHLTALAGGAAHLCLAWVPGDAGHRRVVLG